MTPTARLAITQDNLKDPVFLARLREWAKQDSCVDSLVPSDIRLLVGAIQEYVGYDKPVVTVKEPTEPPVDPTSPMPEQSSKDEPSQFQKELEALINFHSLENGSNTPDFLLAQYLAGCLENFNKTLRARETWYGR